MMKTVHVLFEDSGYNYTTSINPECTFDEIYDYFVGIKFNVGGMDENMQECIAVTVS